MVINIYDDNIGYLTNEVSSVPTSLANANEENRIKFVTDLAAVSRGKSESNNPEKRYQSLLKEAAPKQIDGYKEKSPSRPLEFLPIAINYTIVPSATPHIALKLKNEDQNINLIDFSNNIAKYSYMKDGVLYTNMRCLLNAGIPYDNIPYNDNIEGFIALKAKIPMFVWAQVPNTHNAISKEAQSDRMVDINEYWLPNDILQRIVNKQWKISIDKKTKQGVFFSKMDIRLFVNQEAPTREALVNYFLSIGQSDCQTLFKTLGYPREIYSRAMYYFKYKEVVTTAWIQDPNTWKHLLVERNSVQDVSKNWTQTETNQFTNSIKYLIVKDLGIELKYEAQKSPLDALIGSTMRHGRKKVTIISVSSYKFNELRVLYKNGDEDSIPLTDLTQWK